MRVKKEEVLRLFKATKSGDKGWNLGDCCYCGGRGKLGIIFGDKISSFTCRKCGETGILSKILKYVDRLDLIEEFKSTTPSTKLESIEAKEEVKITYEVLEENLPLGFTRVQSNDYLISRGFKPLHFEVNEIGITTIDPRVTNDYVIFIVRDYLGRIGGWLGRSTRKDEWIKAYNIAAKKLNKPPYLRWRNSKSDFGKLLLGIETVIKGVTKTVIVVEGPTSKYNTDILLDLYLSDEIKCLCSFGKKLTAEQIEQIKDKEVENVILLYDPDAILEAKKYSWELEKKIKEVLVGFIPFTKENGESKDPGEINREEALYVLANLESPLIFNISKIPQFKK